MNTFIEVLNDLILESGLTKRQVALRCGITTSQMTYYLRGACPDVLNAVKIAKYFKVSLNYLMGLDSNRNETLNFSYLPKSDLFLKNYYFALKENNLTHYKLCQKIGISESNIRHWKNGKFPKLETIIKISNYLNYSVDYFLGMSKN